MYFHVLRSDQMVAGRHGLTCVVEATQGRNGRTANPKLGGGELEDDPKLFS